MRKISVMTAGTLVLLVASTSIPAYSDREAAIGSISSLNDMAGQIGHLYDPLFYDVMVYIFGTMVFAIFLMSVIAYWIRRKGFGGTSKEKWIAELEKYYEREGIRLLPEESRK
jgi:hypothetical protein